MTDSFNSDDNMILVKLSTDDGRDYTARLVWQMNYRRYLHDKRVVPMPPAPKVTEVNADAGRKKRLATKRKRRKTGE
ncbi:TPA: hypothetical protein I8Y21_004282 [Klebsiella oxytoca]|uniref:Uncharacterized protein n=1 Tax=Klebsiella oxytoca TaxID=571 RepID=A0AAN5LBA2_KLEOX|nr:hypothetical protein [Klebsiella oxytoca]